MCSQNLAEPKVELNVHHQRNVSCQARRLANRFNLRISKSRKRLTLHNYGGYRIVHCAVLAGSRYNLTADEVYDFLLNLVGDGHLERRECP